MNSMINFWETDILCTGYHHDSIQLNFLVQLLPWSNLKVVAFYIVEEYHDDQIPIPKSVQPPEYTSCSTHTSKVKI